MGVIAELGKLYTLVPLIPRLIEVLAKIEAWHARGDASPSAYIRLHEIREEMRAVLAEVKEKK